MTHGMMATRTLEQLADLDLTTKRELMAMIRNKIQIISGTANLVAARSKGTEEVKAYLIVKDCSRFVTELEELLKIKTNAVG